MTDAKVCDAQSDMKPRVQTADQQLGDSNGACILSDLPRMADVYPVVAKQQRLMPEYLGQLCPFAYSFVSLLRFW